MSGLFILPSAIIFKKKKKKYIGVQPKLEHSTLYITIVTSYHILLELRVSIFLIWI